MPEERLQGSYVAKHGKKPNDPRNIRPATYQLSLMFNVIVSLIIRETKTRFGAHRLGYLWALIEPAVFVLMFVSVHSAIEATVPFGESVLLFIVPAILFVRVFIGITGRMKDAIRANMALMTYPPVKIVDTILSRFILEALTMLFLIITFFLMLNIALGYNVVLFIDKFALSVGALLFLCLGIGAFNATVSILWPAWAQIWSWTGLPLMILSGVFFVPDQLPLEYQKIVFWNPVLHCVEWMRTATYLTYEPLINPFYPILVAGLSLIIALILERVYRYKILSS